MPKYVCLEDCFAPVRNADGSIQTYIPDSAKPHVTRHKTRHYQEGQVYNFPDSEMVPQDRVRVRAFDDDGRPKLLANPWRPNDPNAPMVPDFERDIDYNTGRVTTRYEDAGITKFRMLNAVTGAVMSREETNAQAEKIRQAVLSEDQRLEEENAELRRQLAELKAQQAAGRQTAAGADADVADAVAEMEAASAVDPDAGEAPILKARVCVIGGCNESLEGMHPNARYCNKHKRRSGPADDGSPQHDAEPVPAGAAG